MINTSPYLGNGYNYCPVRQIGCDYYPKIRIDYIDEKNDSLKLLVDNKDIYLKKNVNCYDFDENKFYGCEKGVNRYIRHREEYLKRFKNIEVEEGVDKINFISRLEKENPTRLGFYEYEDVMKFVGDDIYYGMDTDNSEYFIQLKNKKWCLEILKEKTNEIEKYEANALDGFTLSPNRIVFTGKNNKKIYLDVSFMFSNPRKEMIVTLFLGYSEKVIILKNNISRSDYNSKKVVVGIKKFWRGRE